MKTWVLAMAMTVGLATLCGSKVAEAVQIGALSTDCKASGFDRGHRAYQFVATCAGRAMSPDGRYAIVQRAYRDHQPPIELQTAGGRVVARLPELSDDMPFVVLWSPDSRRIAVNHHVGSFMDDLRLFEIVGNKVVPRSALIVAAKHLAVQRFRCLSPGAVLPNAARWSADGHRLMIVTVSSLYACSDTAKAGDWWPLWMIGDVRTGRIDPASIRIDKADGPLREPRDTLYRGF
ncbi:hypothetical protein JAO74_10945 [Sphingomonas sp. BT553]|uniref:Uncharacterized protein n=2 Tax=Sphingomonas mollis TaxID=2795726 RepID=A0ABS0XQI9_9SPHN|nr:hypothetical protein [Sphingomonas sp. BT553]